MYLIKYKWVSEIISKTNGLRRFKIYPVKTMQLFVAARISLGFYKDPKRNPGVHFDVAHNHVGRWGLFIYNFLLN